MIFDSISIPSEMPVATTAPATTSNATTTTATTATAPPAASRRFTETWKGFIQEPLDAQLVIEGCVSGLLQPLNIIPMSLSDLTIRSGTVLVFAENSAMGQMVRWRDGCRWSASRLQGPFLLYREVEASSNTSSSEPERDVRFVNTVVRGKTKFVANGMAKRTLTLTGSDGNRYRVISYFYPADVAHLYGDPVVTVSEKVQMLSTPSRMPEFARFVGKTGPLPSFTMPDLSYQALRRPAASS
ncbi:hypothetical protein HDU79_006180, partial [Rhizoclosmatium sp. JEL0117]